MRDEYSRRETRETGLIASRSRRF